MTIEEMMKDSALQAELEREAEALVKAGMSPAEARQKVLKDRGIELDEDAVKAETVGRMKLSDEALDTVSGGFEWCTVDHSCFIAHFHDRNETRQACFSDHLCFFVYSQS